LLAASVGWQAKAVVLAYGHQPPQSKIRRLQPASPWAGDTMCRGLATTKAMGFDELRRFPVISNQFQSIPITFQKNMKRSAANLNEACLAGWTASVGSERGLAGESGVAARALPPQSKTCWLQPASPWAGDMMCRGLAAINAMGFDELRWFPVISNQFQSIPIIFWGIMKRSAANLNEACLAGWAVFVGSERRLAGESGGTCVRPPATSVQNTSVAAGVALGRRHDVPGAGSDKLHGV